MDGLAVIILCSLGGLFKQVVDFIVKFVVELRRDVHFFELIFDYRLDDQICHSTQDLVRAHLEALPPERK